MWMSLMRLKFLRVLMAAWALNAMASMAADEAPSAWLPWQQETIRVGNERDGFHDTVAVRRRLSNPAYGNGHMKMPYLAQVPDEKRLLLMVHCGFEGAASAADCQNYLMESTDEGETWSAPFSPWQEPMTSGWGLTCCGNGVILIGNGHSRSVDGGKTWQWRPLEVDPRFGKFIIGWDPCFVFPDSQGRHLLDMAYFTRNFELPESKLLPLVRESHDAGETWSPWRGIPEFPGVSEITIIANAQGELVAAMRATTLMAPSNDHSDRLEYSISKDGGKTWAPPKVVAGSGRHHPSMALLPDGRIAMTYVVRHGYPDEDGRHVYGIEAVLSHDGGHTWDVDHRYQLARWTHDCVVLDERQNPVQVEKFWGAPQATSTVYLAESKELITAYGTSQNISHRVGGEILPRQCALVKWRPLDNYSAVKDAPPPPIPAEEALRTLRANTFWLANYDARIGYPDGGWIQRYPRRVVSLHDGWLHLDHRPHTGNAYALRGTDLLDLATGAVGLRMRLNVPPEDDPGFGERCMVYAVVGSGRDKFEVLLGLDANAQLFDSRPFKRVPLPTRAGTPFLLEAWFDPRSQWARLWIDGELVAEASLAGCFVAPEYPCRLWFGRGTPRTGGTIDIAEFKFGEL